jgi:hypothetical protein
MPLITLRKYLRSSGSLGTILARYRRSFLLRTHLHYAKDCFLPVEMNEIHVTMKYA